MPGKLLCLVVAAAPLLMGRASHAQSVLIVPAGDEVSAAGGAITRAVETAVLDLMPDVAVVTPRSLGDKMELDLIRACDGGDDASCTAQFSDALGVEWVLRPQLSRLGEVLLLTLSLYDTREAAVRGQAQRQASADAPEALLRDIPGLVAEVGRQAGLPMRPGPVRPFPTPAVVSIGAGGVLLAGAAVLLGVGAWQEVDYQAARFSRDQAVGWERARPLVFGTSALVGVVGAVLAGYGVLELLE